VCKCSSARAMSTTICTRCCHCNAGGAAFPPDALRMIRSSSAKQKRQCRHFFTSKTTSIPSAPPVQSSITKHRFGPSAEKA
jgi:hypothetical protein